MSAPVRHLCFERWCALGCTPCAPPFSVYASLALDDFATYNDLKEAFHVARFTPNMVLKTGDIFSLMNLVSGAIGCTLLPGRVRDVFEQKVQLLPPQAKYMMRQSIGINFLHAPGRDSNLLAVCRMPEADLA